MIEPAINKIKELTQQAVGMQQARVLKINQEPEDVYYIETAEADGSRMLERHIAEPEPRCYQATTLTGLVQMIQGFEKDLGVGTDAASLKEKGGVSVFVSRGVITAVMGERERRHTATLKVECTDAFKTLKEWERQAQLEQRAMLWTFRTAFAGEVGPSGTVAKLKSLKWKSHDDGQSNVGTGQSSLGRDVEVEVLAGGETIPEEIIVTANVYAGVDELRDVKGWFLPFKVAFDVDFQKKQFVLKTLPEQCQAAMNAADQLIADEIERVCHADTRVIVGGVFNQ